MNRTRTTRRRPQTFPRTLSKTRPQRVGLQVPSGILKPPAWTPGGVGDPNLSGQTPFRVYFGPPVVETSLFVTELLFPSLLFRPEETRDRRQECPNWGPERLGKLSRNFPLSLHASFTEPVAPPVFSVPAQRSNRCEFSLSF